MTAIVKQALTRARTEALIAMREAAPDRGLTLNINGNKFWCAKIWIEEEIKKRMN